MKANNNTEVAILEKIAKVVQHQRCYNVAKQENNPQYL